MMRWLDTRHSLSIGGRLPVFCTLQRSTPQTVLRPDGTGEAGQLEPASRSESTHTD